MIDSEILPEIESERISLRWLEDRDVDALFTVFSDQKVIESLTSKTESQAQERNNDVKDFLTGVENASDKEWIRNYFAGRYFEMYPEQTTVGDVIEDIASRAKHKSGRDVYDLV